MGGSVGATMGSVDFDGVCLALLDLVPKARDLWLFGYRWWSHGWDLLRV